MRTEKPLILIVDDESDSLAYLFDLLHNEGYRVLPTSSPFEALEHTATKKPKLVITDLRMPDVDGMELLERVRSISPGTRVILLTAYGDLRTHQELVQKGGETLLLKPSSNEEILRAVRMALEEEKPCSA